MLRRGLMGLMMGLTAIAIIYSPWGQQSGAHINPAVTLTFWRLGKVATWDAVFYVWPRSWAALAGVLLVLLAARRGLRRPAGGLYRHHARAGRRRPSRCSPRPLISFGLMTMVLFTTNTPRLMRFTGVFAGCLVALYITVEAPLSGMSMNPARTLASALPGQLFEALVDLLRRAGRSACCSRSRPTG